MSDLPNTELQVAYDEACLEIARLLDQLSDAQKEIEALKHDIGRYVKISCELSDDVDAAQKDISELESRRIDDIAAARTEGWKAGVEAAATYAWHSISISRRAAYAISDGIRTLTEKGGD